MKESFGIAVKAFIVKEDKLLIIKRGDDDEHKPGIWEIPGGRLAPAEDPFEGLKREVKEETGLDIAILNPLKVKHFTRDDGQKITMLVFLCKPITEETNISEEHSQYKWIEVDNAEAILHPLFHDEVKIFRKYFKNNGF